MAKSSSDMCKGMGPHHGGAMKPQQTPAWKRPGKK